MGRVGASQHHPLDPLESVDTLDVAGAIERAMRDHRPEVGHPERPGVFGDGPGVGRMDPDDWFGMHRRSPQSSTTKVTLVDRPGALLR